MKMLKRLLPWLFKSKSCPQNQPEPQPEQSTRFVPSKAEDRERMKQLEAERFAHVYTAQIFFGVLIQDTMQGRESSVVREIWEESSKKIREIAAEQDAIAKRGTPRDVNEIKLSLSLLPK